MNRLQIATYAARLVNESQGFPTTTDNWDQATINNFVNVGYQWMQERVLEVDSEAFLYIDTADIVKDQQFYAKPPMHYEIELGYSDNPSTTDYLPLSLRTYGQLRDPSYVRGAATSSDLPDFENQFAHFGDYFYLGWKPSANVTDGLQLSYVPVLAMGSDSDVPELKPNLHYGIALAAAIFALGETPEDVGKLQTNLAMIIQKIPSWYRRTGQAEPFEVLGI
ncbi:MAG: hypothetical protein ACFFFO_16465 [Candidatus Thorarchaeota archaeon]